MFCLSGVFFIVFGILIIIAIIIIGIILSYSLASVGYRL